jgi:hypothetical protein
MIAYPGTFRYRAGKRTAQRYTYSPDFPALEYNTTQGAFFGGNFWDARSTGYKLQSADAEQAQHPPVDTQEMGFRDTACFAFRLSKAVYRPLFELVWGADFHIRWPANTEKICPTPGGAARFGGSAMPFRRPQQGKQYLRPMGAVHFQIRTLKSPQPVHVEIRRLAEGEIHLNARRDGRLQPLQR